MCQKLFARKKSSLCRLFPEVVLLLTTLVILRVETQKCRDGWFGANCTYQCRCSGPLVCGSNGTCDAGTCLGDYFGDTCQYLDAVRAQAVKSTPMFLRDGNDGTCNTNLSATSVGLELNTEQSSVWFRIIFRTSTILISDFEANINKAGACSSETKFLGTGFVDVTCFGLRTYIKNLDIVGDIARNVCSIYISLGRNVALKQKATHSHINRNAGNPQYAVDGNTNPELNKGSCSQTRLREVGMEWNLDYSQEQILLHIKITNRNAALFRLGRFSMAGWNGSNYLTFYYKDNSQSLELLSYHFLLSSRMPTSRIQIVGQRNNYDQGPELVLCEVETFGETVCADGAYGLNCEEKCSCNRTDICNQVTGLCATGCPDGFYGYECNQQCSTFCANDLCYQRTAHCLSCHDGFYGEFCNLACSPGRYGPECKLSCSNQCLRVCHHVYGNCPCKGNFAPPTCHGCVYGKWGPNCTDKCSELCDKLGCDQVTGYCVECSEERLGPLCELCSSKFYGTNCTMTCSAYCLDQMCDANTGFCSVCVGGYRGPKCDVEVMIGLEWIFVVVVSVIPLFFIGCIVGLKRTVAAKESWDNGKSRENIRASSYELKNELSAIRN